MKVYENPQYQEDVKYVANLDLPWDKLKNKSIMISGATGLIGSMLIDVIMMKNLKGLNCIVYALGRSKTKMFNRFEYCFDNSYFNFIEYDVNKKLEMNSILKIDYILHLASNTHPMQYATDPIGTITTNIIGVQNLLDFAVEHKTTRFAFASSNEIYGENRGDVEKFDEKYCGYIDCNTTRAGYPESKRCGEALCQAYVAQKGLDIVIPRLTRTYGPTLLKTDTKALSQFIHKGVAAEDIVLKSEGNQYYSYLYVMDSVSGLLTVLLKGKCGEAYNIADEASDVTLKDLAKIIADYVDKNVIFELPDVVESAGYSKATKARLDSAKLNKLEWKARYDINTGLRRTIDILKLID
jgi:UDP-glucuronate decarboxylase